MKKFRIEVELYKEGSTGEERMNSFYTYLQNQISKYPNDLTITHSIGSTYAEVSCLTEKGEGMFTVIWSDAEDYREMDEFRNHYGIFSTEIEKIENTNQFYYGDLDLKSMTPEQLNRFISNLIEAYNIDQKKMAPADARIFDIQYAKALVVLKKLQDQHQQFKKQIPNNESPTIVD